MNYFIRRQAIDYHKRDVNRTYPVFKNGVLVAYFSIAITSIRFTEESALDERTRISSNIQLGIPKGAFIIGHFAKTKGTERGMIDVLLEMAKSVIRKAQKFVGGNIICLDCDNKKLEKIYLDHGFKVMGRSPEHIGGNFRRMFLLMRGRETQQ